MPSAEILEDARNLLKSSNLCPSVIAYQLDLDRRILRDATNACEMEEWQGGCDLCRADALEAMEVELNALQQRT